MNKISDIGQSNKKKNDSLILSLLSRLYIFIRCSFSHSIFSCILCACANAEERFQKSFIVSFVKNSHLTAFIKNALTRFCRFTESEPIVKFTKQIMNDLLCRSSRDYGIFFASSAVYVMISFIINKFALENDEAGKQSLIVAAVMFALSMLFISSKESLSSMLCRNKICRFITFDIFGATKRVIYERDMVISNPAVPLLLGIPAGVLCILFPPITVLSVFFVSIVTAIILFKTDIGILAALVCVPLNVKEYTVFFASLTVISYIYKVLRNKKTFKFELSDAFVSAAVFAGVLSVSFSHDASAYSAFGLFCCLPLYFCIKNTVRSWNCIKRCIIVQVFAFFAVGSYFVLASALSTELFVETVLPIHLSKLFSDYQTVAMYAVCMLPYLLVAADSANRKRDKFSLILLISVGLFMAFSTYSYGACACVIMCLALFLLTYSARSFSFTAVFTAPLLLILWFAVRSIPDPLLLGYTKDRVGVIAEMTAVYGYTFTVLLLLACVAFFGYTFLYINECYFDITHKKAISKTVSAPIYSVLFLMLCTVFIPGADHMAVLFMLFIQMSLGMAMTSYASEQDRIENQWYVGGEK